MIRAYNSHHATRYTLVNINQYPLALPQHTAHSRNTERRSINVRGSIGVWVDRMVGFNVKGSQRQKAVHKQFRCISYLHFLLLLQQHRSSIFQQNFDNLVAPGTVLGSTQLVHLGHTLLELFVLAFLIGVSLVLYVNNRVSRQPI